MTVGYSGTPLAKKLGIKAGFKVVTIGSPVGYSELLAPLPEDVDLTHTVISSADLIHVFTNSRNELFSVLSKYRHLIKQEGVVWVSWYKKSAKLPTEITEDLIREAALPLGFVDVKVCAIDENWSGLKLVIRRENRL
jgi:hypothetical protein